MKSFFNATCKANVVGDGTVGATIAWLEKFINVLFPDNGIEYWSDNQYSKGIRNLKRGDLVPGAGCTDDCVHHVACYVRQGSCEGRIIEVALSLRGGEFKSLTWMKSFGNADECWQIARAIDEALNSIIFWEEVPELVSMSEKVPRQHNWHRQTSLAEEVTILSGTDKVLVFTTSGLILDDHCWADQKTNAGSNATAVTQDWVTVLTNTNAKFKLVKDTTDRLTVPDLPGYVISKRGVDVEGFYVLPPGGNELDDRTYLGYFPNAQAAIQASRTHQAQQMLVAA
jgi:hypothetical protein